MWSYTNVFQSYNQSWKLHRCLKVVFEENFNVFNPRCEWRSQHWMLMITIHVASYFIHDFFISFDGSCCVGLFRCYTFSWPISNFSSPFSIMLIACLSENLRAPFKKLLSTFLVETVYEIRFEMINWWIGSSLFSAFVVASYETIYDSLHQHVVS